MKTQLPIFKRSVTENLKVLKLGWLPCFMPEHFVSEIKQVKHIIEVD
jgi:hypothetical protein